MKRSVSISGLPALVISMRSVTRQKHAAAWIFGDATTVKQIEQSAPFKTMREDGTSVLGWAEMGRHQAVTTFLSDAGAK